MGINPKKKSNKFDFFSGLFFLIILFFLFEMVFFEILHVEIPEKLKILISFTNV